MHGRTLICENVCVCVCVHAHVRRKRESLRVFTHGQIEVKTQNPGYLLESRGSLWFLYSYKKVFFCLYFLGFPGGASGKEPACQHRRCKRLKLTPGSGRSPGGGNGSSLQNSSWENRMDRGAWWATVHGVAKSWTHLSTYFLE